MCDGDGTVVNVEDFKGVSDFHHFSVAHLIKSGEVMVITVCSGFYNGDDGKKEEVWRRSKRVRGVCVWGGGVRGEEGETT